MEVKVSLIITCYNREKFIFRAIRSALNQTINKNLFEVIVVDDHSSDNSINIIETFGDKIIVIKHEKNLGLPSARNSGIKAALGRYVIHLDSDDYVHPELLKIECMFLDLNIEIGAVSCDYFEVCSDETIRIRKSGIDYPIACGIMFRKKYLIDLGLYNEEMLMCEEEELRKRFEKSFKIENIKLPLYRYTKHAENMTNDKKLHSEYKKKL